jgi:hypothetical protein
MLKNLEDAKLSNHKKNKSESNLKAHLRGFSLFEV